MSKHKYPKMRKPRDTSYSITFKILLEIGKDKLFDIWKDNGHRKTSKIISEMLNTYVSAMVIQYIAARKFNWVREISDRSLPIYKGVLSGRIDPSLYKTIKFV